MPTSPRNAHYRDGANSFTKLMQDTIVRPPRRSNEIDFYARSDLLKVSVVKQRDYARACLRQSILCRTSSSGKYLARFSDSKFEVAGIFTP